MISYISGDAYMATVPKGKKIERVALSLSRKVALFVLGEAEIPSGQ